MNVDDSHLESSPIPAEDRRRHPRYLLSLAITMQGENNFYSGLSENISEAGVFIATHQVLAIGTPVALSFTLPSSDEPITVCGTVQWVRGVETAVKDGRKLAAHFAEVHPGIGVQFTDVDPKSTRAIRDFMRVRSPDFFE